MKPRPFWWNSGNINFFWSRTVLHSLLTKFSGCQTSVCLRITLRTPSNEGFWAQSLLPLSCWCSGSRVRLKNLHFYHFPTGADAAGPETTFKSHCLNTAGTDFCPPMCGHLALKPKQPLPTQVLLETGNQQRISNSLLQGDCFTL